MLKGLKYIIKHPHRIPLLLLLRLPYFKFIRFTTNYQCPITFNAWFHHKILNKGRNRNAYWPVHPTSKIVNPENIVIGIDTCPGLMGGCYIQGIGRIFIGDYTQIASNVVIVSANHDLYDSRIHIQGIVDIGKYCWLAANSIILPNVKLGDFTIVGAGSVVTKSFPEGNCVIAGNPAKKIKDLNPEKCIRYEYKTKFNGYIANELFSGYRKKFLKA